MRIVRLEDDIQTTFHGILGGFGVICCGEMQDISAAGSAGIGNDETVKVPFSFQFAVQHPIVRSAGGTVERIVGCHD